MTLFCLDLLWNDPISQKGHIRRHHVLGLVYLSGEDTSQLMQGSKLLCTHLILGGRWEMSVFILQMGKMEAGGGAVSSIGHAVNET